MMGNYCNRHVTHLVHRIPKWELSNNPAVHLGKLCFETIANFGSFFVRSALNVVWVFLLRIAVPGLIRQTLKFSIADVIRVFVTPSRTEQNAFWMNIHWKPEAVLTAKRRNTSKATCTNAFTSLPWIHVMECLEMKPRKYYKTLEDTSQEIRKPYINITLHKD